jgi:hypothetical protein
MSRHWIRRLGRCQTGVRFGSAGQEDSAESWFELNTSRSFSAKQFRLHQNGLHGCLLEIRRIATFVQDVLEAARRRQLVRKVYGLPHELFYLADPV